MKLKAENSDEAATEGTERERVVSQGRKTRTALPRRSRLNIQPHPVKLMGEKYSVGKTALYFKNPHPVHRRDQTLYDKGKCHAGTSH